jgi:hypothetical protein
VAPSLIPKGSGDRVKTDRRTPAGWPVCIAPAAERVEEAIAIAQETVAVAGAHANPFWIAFAHYAYGEAFAEADPSNALRALRTGLVHTQAHRLPYFEALITRESASLEGSHGNSDRALELFDASVDSLHRAGTSPTSLSHGPT